MPLLVFIRKLISNRIVSKYLQGASHSINRSGCCSAKAPGKRNASREGEYVGENTRQELSP